MGWLPSLTLLLCLTGLDSALAQSHTVAFSTYFGGSQEDEPRDVAIDAQGNIYIGGGADSANFPTTAGAYQRVLNPGGAPGQTHNFP